MKHELMLGADPELFLKDADEAFVSAIGKIGGTKEIPIPMGIGDGFAMQEDNVALEYNIPPSKSKDEFVGNINQAMDFLRKKVGVIGLHFAQESATEFPLMELIDPRAKRFGCDPDFNAWTGRRNPRPKAKSELLRSCGGHIHVGYPFKSKQAMKKFVKFMDLCAGVPSTIMDNGGEMRREFYGKMGAYRPKPYGCEYRVLSNYWTLKPELVSWAWDSVERAIQMLEDNQFNIDMERDVVELAINHNDTDAAMYLIAKHKLNYIHA